jgi:hypothetical protein
MFKGLINLHFIKSKNMVPLRQNESWKLEDLLPFWNLTLATKKEHSPMGLNLEFDPIYGVVRLATLGLMKQLRNEFVKETSKANEGFKITIANHKIYLQEPGYKQKVMRTLWQSKREELLSLHKHILIALDWLPVKNQQENESIRTIYTYAIQGYNSLCETYQEDFTSRGLQIDSSYIEKTLTGSVSQLEYLKIDHFKFIPIEELKQKQIKQETLSFKEQELIYFYEKLIPLWNKMVLQNIANNLVLKRIHSLRIDVRENPQDFAKIKTEFNAYLLTQEMLQEKRISEIRAVPLNNVSP